MAGNVRARCDSQLRAIRRHTGMVRKRDVERPASLVVELELVGLPIVVVQKPKPRRQRRRAREEVRFTRPALELPSLSTSPSHRPSSPYNRT